MAALVGPVLIGWLFALVCGAFVLAQVYLATGHSVLCVALWHAAYNTMVAGEAGTGLPAALIGLASMTYPNTLPLIAILRGIRPDEVLADTQALIDAGFDATEIPLCSPDWCASARSLAQAFGQRALVGGGTVLRPADADLRATAGARLVFTPNTQPAQIAHAVARGLYVDAGFAIAYRSATA